MMKIRAAVPSDAAQIVRLLHSSFDPGIFPYTIYRSPRYARFVRDSIAVQSGWSDRTWVVATEPEVGLVGYVELRRSPGMLFLNNIHVSTHLRGRGVGSRLLRGAFERARPQDASTLSLHVFGDNKWAREWYARLGLVQDGNAVDWCYGEIGESAGPFRGGYVEGLEQLRCSLRRYGFGRFVVKSPEGRYEVGKIGDGILRVTEPAILHDQVARTLLLRTAPGAGMLVISSTSDNPDGRQIARALTMTGNLDRAIEGLPE